jgi:hypothetical protein
LLEAQNRLAGIEAERQRQVEVAEAARLKALADKGQADEAIRQLREAKDKELQAEKTARVALEQDLMATHVQQGLNAQLMRVAFTDEDAPDQVRALLAARFEAVRDASGQVAVREKGTGRPQAEVVAEWLRTKPAAKFLAATSRGGSGSSGGDKSPPNPGEEPSDQLVPFDQNIVDVLKGNVPRIAKPSPYGFGTRRPAYPPPARTN